MPSRVTIGQHSNRCFKEPPLISERHQFHGHDSSADSQKLAKFQARDGQLLLSMLDVVEQAQCAIDEVVDVMGPETIEAILRMSAKQLAGAAADQHIYRTRRRSPMADRAASKLVRPSNRKVRKSRFCRAVKLSGKTSSSN